MSTFSPLHCEQGRQLLDKIDQLRALPNIHREIALPQIVVVGQQSSGKSSVLKAISNIKFPTKTGLCTHFATEIICRREAKERPPKVSIIPSETPDPQYSARLDEFADSWRHLQPGDDISKVIESAKHAMGINDYQKISRDKLRLEFSGPNQDHISLVDLPGLFEQVSDDQRAEDKLLVDEMVKEYISRDHTIILAVISGNLDRGLQRVTGLCEDHFPRVLGVVTAPDELARNSGRIAEFSKLVASSVTAHGYGWHMLRNLSEMEEREGGTGLRDQVEKDFFASPLPALSSLWGRIDESRRGIEPLKSKLATLLRTKVAEELPGISKQLQTALDSCKKELLVLGNERTTPDQQRDYLARHAEKLVSETTIELIGGNGVPSLRSRIRDANDQFAEHMSKFGHSWECQNDIAGTKALIDLESRNAGPEDPPELITLGQWLASWTNRISKSRGRELDGLIDHQWVGRMFVSQSYKWEAIAQSHAERCHDIVTEWFVEVTKRIFEPEHATRFLEYAIHPGLEKRRHDLLDKVTEISRPYRTEHIRTLNRNFRIQEQNLRDAHPDQASTKTPAVRGPIEVFTDIMWNYYHVAMAVFADNFESLAIENVLLRGLEEIMTPIKAYNLDIEELAILAAESEDVTEKRQVLRSKIAQYEEGVRIISEARTSSWRTSTRVSRIEGASSAVDVPRTAAPSITIASPATTGYQEPQAPDDKASSSSSSSTVIASGLLPSSSRRRSVSSSSRSSSSSRVFGEDGASEEGSLSTNSSAASTPCKDASVGKIDGSGRRFRTSSTNPRLDQSHSGTSLTDLGTSDTTCEL